MADNILQLESTSGFSGANLFVSGGATFTALATFSGGISAAGGVTFGGTINATTAPVGTNTTQVATTAFVQNEIVADAVTAFNGRTGSVQGVSSAAAGTGISVSAATGAVTITNTGVLSFNGNTGVVQGVSSAAAGTGISVSAATGAVTITNTGVQSFNGLTGAVTGVTVGGANTFTALQTFNSGITTSFLYASTGSTFGSTLQVNGGATLASTLDVTGVARFAGGVTFSGTTDHAGVNRFAGGVTFSGTVASNTGYRVTSSAINAQTGTTYTLVSGDNGEIITFNNASGITLTIPSGLPVGFNCTLIQLGAGQVGITGASGVTLNSYASAFKISGQHGAAGVISYSSNVYNISGTLSV